MKTEAIGIVKGIVKSNVIERTEKAVSNTIKDEAKILKGQEALAAQGKAMVKKPYTKPEANIVKINTEKIVAASNDGTNHGYTGGELPPGGPEGEPDYVKDYNIWERGFGDGGNTVW